MKKSTKIIKSWAPKHLPDPFTTLTDNTHHLSLSPIRVVWVTWLLIFERPQSYYLFHTHLLSRALFTKFELNWNKFEIWIDLLTLRTLDNLKTVKSIFLGLSYTHKARLRGVLHTYHLQRIGGQMLFLWTDQVQGINLSWKILKFIKKSWKKCVKLTSTPKKMTWK